MSQNTSGSWSLLEIASLTIHHNLDERFETFRQVARTLGIAANPEVFDLEQCVSRGSPKRSNQGTSREGKRPPRWRRTG